MHCGQEAGVTMHWWSGDPPKTTIKNLATFFFNWRCLSSWLEWWIDISVHCDPAQLIQPLSWRLTFVRKVGFWNAVWLAAILNLISCIRSILWLLIFSRSLKISKFFLSMEKKSMNATENRTQNPRMLIRNPSMIPRNLSMLPYILSTEPTVLAGNSPYSSCI